MSVEYLSFTGRTERDSRNRSPVNSTVGPVHLGRPMLIVHYTSTVPRILHLRRSQSLFLRPTYVFPRTESGVIGSLAVNNRPSRSPKLFENQLSCPPKIPLQILAFQKQLFPRHSRFSSRFASSDYRSSFRLSEAKLGLKLLADRRGVLSAGGKPQKCHFPYVNPCSSLLSSGIVYVRLRATRTRLLSAN